jgi:hypothetical protein
MGSSIHIAIRQTSGTNAEGRGRAISLLSFFLFLATPLLLLGLIA